MSDDIQALNLGENLPANISMEVVQELAKRIAESKTNLAEKRVTFKSDPPAIKKISPVMSPEVSGSPAPDLVQSTNNTNIDNGIIVQSENVFNIFGMLINKQTVYFVIVILVIGISLHFLTRSSGKKKKREDEE